MTKKVAVVTGSNKGIGFAIVKGLLQRFDGVVYLTSRDSGRGKAAVGELNKLGLNPAFHQLDVSDRESVLRFRDHIQETCGGIDILVNNAAVANSVKLYNTYEEDKEIIDINYYSILTIQELLFPLVRDNGRILNISSDCGHLSNVRNKHWLERLSKKDFTQNDVLEFVNWYLEAAKNGTFKKEDLADDATVGAYRVAKVALSAQTILQQRHLASRNISVNSMHPGLVRTSMTKGVGFFSTDEAAKTPLYLILEAPQDLKGTYVWYDGRVLDWFDYNADYYFKSKTLTS
ncbi:carbonyl reductase [NADPH] 1-like [Ostrinia furnacalis]|uniref:carbonyl reductase [NADPH] 1-like n=1 Tax=Ostrinia furnacalis TaxID=93504 RepID=UPI00103912F3|nr:carbonyl reductase [NADPH] 1-like [Ostrinia furnacalis]